MTRQKIMSVSRETPDVTTKPKCYDLKPTFSVRKLAASQARNAIIKKSGKNPITGLSGRDLFTFDASLFVAGLDNKR